LTYQVTLEFVVPVTFAANCCELPARTLAGFGVTETCTLPEVGGFGGAAGGAGEGCVPETPAQPACNPASNERRISKLRRTEITP
jgi:hypothetical protein